MKRATLACLLSLLAVSTASAQQFPNIAAQSVVGRLGIPGDTGPSQAIPFATLKTYLGTVFGPGSATVVGDLVLWNSITGTILKDGGPITSTGLSLVASASAAAAYGVLGVVPCANLPALTGAITSAGGTCSTLIDLTTINYLAPGTGAVARTVNSKLTDTVSILDYGAKCNANMIASAANLSITSGQAILTVSSAPFTSADVGKSMYVPGAGVASAGLSSSILTFTDASHVVLANNASTTLSAVAASQAAPLIYGTDDTPAINAAITATPNFGTLYINPSLGGCLIKQAGATGHALTVNHPINIKGGGNLSRLLTDGSMGTTIGGIHALVSGLSWRGIVWENFTLGTDTNFNPFTRFGERGIWFDATTGGASGFLGINIRNVSIGESGNYYSLVLDGIGSQGNRIENNYIWGGVYLDNVIDSNIMQNNRLDGTSIFGVRVNNPASGNFQFVGNSMTAAGGFCYLAGNWPIIQNNYFEEVHTPNFAHGAFVDLGCASGVAVVGAQVQNNIIANIISTTSLAILIYATTDATMIQNNFIANNNARTAVTNNGTLTVCGPNKWQTSATHINGTGALTLNYGAC